YETGSEGKFASRWRAKSPDALCAVLSQFSIIIQNRLFCKWAKKRFFVNLFGQYRKKPAAAVFSLRQPVLEQYRTKSVW
ncbi:hypothetical protein, partial [Ruminococcus callidus]|uniref:hypothetical protein n=2 Tax=Ruminococcus callidus TaxID=40519 RepID=UPI00266B8613